MLDVLITGAEVYPGDGPPVLADVGIEGERIALVRPVAAGELERRRAVAANTPDEAALAIDGTGLLLCPGFIDLHAHSALRVLVDPLQEPKLAQGFTTELINLDGLAPAPVAAAGWPEREAYLRPIEGPGPERPGWSSLDEFLAVLEAARPATNLVAAVGHNAVREYVMGRDNRPATPDELARMCREVRAGLEAGARAVSFGLIYVPGLFANTAELTALARVAAQFGAPLVPHIRNEGAGILDALREVIGVARESGAPLHISHLKLIGNGELLEPLLALIDEAAGEIPLTFDQYPYGAGSTTLAAILPPWAQAGGGDALRARLTDPPTRRRIVEDTTRGLPGWENIYGSCGPERVVVVDAPPAYAGTIGRTLAEIGDERGVDPLVAALDLLAEAGSGFTMIDHYASDDVVRAIFRHPLAMVCTDGIFGPRPHPRLHGTAARVLGRFALRDGLVPVEDAVARLTARPADLLGLADRGRIREGLRADLVLLDPRTYVDTATYDDPARLPTGVEAVVVGGRIVLRGEGATGERPGRITRTPRRTGSWVRM
ncbi:MAG TPA: D-aminoacylase [Candidatus Binatia bacterium]|nr:D-aminoacylase [Candidatus Binatia bacterium]